MKKKIIFVDDEPMVLEGLQRMLRGMREEWDMRFCTSGPEALEAMRQEPCQVVVTDMRMPGMDGAQFLTEVMRLNPQTVRIILSGHSDPSYVLKSVRPAHQYLSKPCEPELLISVVKRAFALRNLLADEALKKTIAQIDTLPSLPSLYAEIMQELHSPSSSLQKVGQIISKDVAMTAKVLQLVNSAFFGLQRHVSNPPQAVNLLGLDTIKALVLSVQIFSQFPANRSPSLSFEGLWKHSFSTGVLAKAFAQMEHQSKIMIDDSFMAGLLHDMGILILAMNFPDRYGEAKQREKEGDLLAWQAEKEVFGSTHAEVGAYLVGLWGIPDPIVEGIAFHHDPAQHVEDRFSPLLTVHVANALDRQLGGTDPAMASPIDKDFLSRMGFMDRLPAWEEKARSILQKGDEHER